MLSAKKVSDALSKRGIDVISYEESKDPKLMDGEVTLKNALSVQVGFDYACLCIIKEDSIDYLLEVEGIYCEEDIASQVAKFLKDRGYKNK
jgi:hypothetical protein